MRDLCILRLSALGDVCNLVPSVRALQTAQPELKITWIIGRAEYSLLEGLEGVDFLVYDKKTGLAGMAALRKKLLAQRNGQPFDVLLHMQAALRASLLSRFIPARRRIGFDAERAKDFQNWFVHEQLAANPRQHVGEGFLDFVRHLGVQPGPLQWGIPLPQTAVDEARRWQPEDQAYLVLSPCSSNRARNWRNWSNQGYAALVDYAYENYGLQTLLTGGPTELEQETAKTIAELAKAPVINATGQTSLKALLCLIRDARLVVAPDSGPIHMAVAMQTPPLGLYATSNPDRTGPWLGREFVANRYPEAVKHFLDRDVNQVGWGQRVRDPAALDLITQEDVQQRLDAIMNSKEKLA
ncbi:heptosyltransferase I [Marinospirillum celere]|uniref:Heptosyltransferase I n=1 Tax=Marinospirillum celere TaxID=1122252 RepID=A0A1I1I7Y5_9GAMM|nr:heptosyltransferase I [Marinospirillum celere]